ncbi:MAG: hypothetical protein ACTHZ9_01790 [Leucobacter sp.]
MRNGGNPLSAIDLATAIGKSPGSSTIRTLSAASSSYGLTGGGLKSTTTMEALGRAITSPKEKARSLVAAALNPPTFKEVYDDYKGKKVRDTMDQYGASAVMYDDCVILFKEKDVNLASNFSGIGYISFEKDRLDAEMNALLGEFVALKLLKLSVGDDD